MRMASSRPCHGVIQRGVCLLPEALFALLLLPIASCASLRLSGCVAPPGCDEPITGSFQPGHMFTPCRGYLLTFQTDGNLVLYNPERKAVWSSQTAGRNATQLVMQSDGNLVIYAGSKPLWSTETSGHPGAFLAMEAKGMDAAILAIEDKEHSEIWTQPGL